MLKDTNPHGAKGRHHRLNQQHQSSRRHLRAGMARVALESRVTGKPAEDSVGRPLLYANEMAQRHNAGTLEKWAEGRSTQGAFGGMDFCARCHKVPSMCRCRKMRTRIRVLGPKKLLDRMAQLTDEEHAYYDMMAKGGECISVGGVVDGA
mgnify:CR=1 FL=1